MLTNTETAIEVGDQTSEHVVDFDLPTRPRTRRGEVGDLSTARLEVELVDLAARLAAGTYELLVLVGEYDDRGTWALHGALSCARWLADLSDIEVSTARTQVRIAAALREFAELDAAMRNGDLSYAKARVLVPWLTKANATELIGIAETTPAGRLGMAIAAWAHRNDDQDLIEQYQRDIRTCTWRTEGDGTVMFTARLTPAAAGAVCAVIDAQVTRSTPAVAVEAPNAPIDPQGDEPDGPAGGSPGYPSLAQQRADALVTVITKGSAGKVDAEVLVHVREGGNFLADGTPLSDHTVTKVLPEAFVALLVHDADDEPSDASPRRRFPTPRQRKVIEARQDQCQQPGCGARNFLDYDHIHPYTKGGPTILDNLQRLCGTHNRAKAATMVPREQSK